jgi:hypothetical protein
MSPYQKATLYQPDLTPLHMFGCKIYVLSTKHRPGNITTHNAINSKIMGYGGWIKNFIYIKNATKKTGHATHTTFDEAQLSTPVADLNSYSLALWGTLILPPPPPEEVLIMWHP